MPNILYYILSHTSNVYNPYDNRSVGFDNYGQYFIKHDDKFREFVLQYLMHVSNKNMVLFHDKDLKNVEKYFVNHINSTGGCYLNSLDIYRYEEYIKSKGK